MTTVMRRVLEKLVRNESCKVMPVTRLALKRNGFITYSDASERRDRIIVTDAGRAALVTDRIHDDQ